MDRRYFNVFRDQNQGEWAAVSADNKDMRKLAALSLFTFSALMTMLVESSANAYSTSQENQWRQDFAEAKARALDFEKHLARQRAMSRERESAAHEIKTERKREEERVESSRHNYVVERNRRPDPEIEQMRLEREHEKDVAKLEREALKVQAGFAKSREKVDRLIAKDAYINPALEYDVHSRKSNDELARTMGPAPLKLRIEKGSETK